MKKILNVIVLLMVITIMSGCELFTKEEEKFVTFSYNDSVYNDYKCKIKEGKINCMILEPENGDLAFMGWYDENDNKVDIEGEFESSITLHPKFLTEGETQKEKLSAKKYTITFDNNGGSGSIDKVEVEYEGQLYKLKSLPKRSGYVFLGFYDSKETGKGKQYYNEKGESIRNFDKVNNTTLYARWSKEVKQESTPSTPVEPPKEEKKYTITFNVNNGSGGQTSSVSVTNGSTMPSISKTAPTRKGYIFVGWYDNSDYIMGTQYYKADGSSARTYDKTSNMTLYAGWKKEEVKLVKYTVIYDRNGGNGSVSSQSVESGKNINLQENKYTKVGYTFTGWNTQKDSKGKAYKEKESIKVISNITLYAMWSANKYTVTFNLNSGNGNVPNSVTATYGSVMPSISGIPTRSGYTFMGWYDNTDWTKGTQYYKEDNLSARIYNKTSNITLYAGWEKKEDTSKPTYTVAFNLNSGNGTIPSSVKATNGSSMPNITSTVPSKTGYTFMGWYDNSDYTKGKQYYTDKNKSARSYDKKAATTLYAGWKANTFTVSYNSNGGSGTTKNITCTYDKDCKLSSNGFTKTGYKFTGWKKNNTGSVVAAGSSIKNVVTSGTVTYYAVWEEVTATLTYNSNGHGTAPSAVTMKYSAKVNAASALTATGYTFNKWCTSSNGSGTCYNAGAEVKAANKTPSNITLYAIWKANTFTVAYNANGGSGSTASHTCTYDKDCKLSSNGFTRSGYIFTGWKKNNTGSVVAAGSSIKNAVASGTVTYYAQWSNSTYTVSFNINNGSGTTPNKVTATYGSAMPKITTTVPTRTGYTFMGWYDNADYTKGTQYYKENNLSARTYNKYAATTLYAGWKVNTYKITFNLNNGSGTTPSKVTVTYNEPLPKLTIKAPTRSKYVFQGWYDSSDWTKAKKYYNADGTSARPYDKTKSAVLYAGWRKSGENIKVASFNIGYFSCGNSTPNCLGSQNEYQNHSISIFTANTIKNEGIDIIGFQEIRDPYNGGCTIQGKYCRFNNVNCIYSVDYLRYILKSLGINTNNSTELNKHFVHSCPANVDATYSKYEVDTSKTKTYDLGGSRTIDKVVIKVNGVNISFYNTHLGLYPDNEGHWKKMTDIVTKDENPVIITGDFNFREISRYNTYLKEKGFIIAAHDDIKHNMNHNPHYMDSVFVRPYGSDNVSHISTVSSKTIDMYDKYSDHNLIIAELSIY